MKIEKISFQGMDAVFMETNVYEAVIIPSVGANLVRLYNKEKKVDVLRTPTEAEMATFQERPQIFGVPMLFPPNRIADGNYSFAGKKYEFPITIPAQNNYHHGIIKSQPFSITRTRYSSDAVEVEATFCSNRYNDEIYKDFPHEFVCKIRFILTDQEMTQIISFNNLGNKAMPFGLGFHTPLRMPFLGNTDKADYKMRLSAGKRWELNDRGLPTEQLLDLTEEEAQLRKEGMPVSGKAIELALTDEALVVAGKPFHGAILTHEKEKVSVYYEVDKQFKHWTLWNNGGEVEYVCPEPQTWAINAPNLKLAADITGFQAINGGKSWSGTTRFYVR